MLQFDFTDERLTELLDSILSGLVYKENFDRNLYIPTLDMVNKYIKLEEFTREYYILFHYAISLRKIMGVVEHYVPVINKLNFDTYLRNKMPVLLKSEFVQITKILEENDLPTDIDNNEENYNKACNLLYKMCMDLFNTAIEKNIGSVEVLSLEPAFKEAILTNTSEVCTTIGSHIIYKSYKVGRTIYKGSQDWLKYMTVTTLELNRRMSVKTKDDALKGSKDISHAFKLLDKGRELAIPLANYGIPELDAQTPILRRRITIYIGEKGSGKTMLAIHNIVSLLLEGRRVLLFRGESPIGLTLNKILSAYILRKYGCFVSYNMLQQQEALPPEYEKIRNIAYADLINSDLLFIEHKLTHGSIKMELQNYYDLYKYDAVFMDHTLNQVVPQGIRMAPQEKVAEIASAVEELKDTLPCAFHILSQPSSRCIEDLAKSKVSSGVNYCVWSSELDYAADEIFVLCKTTVGEKRNLLSFYVPKCRNGVCIYDPIMLSKEQFAYCTYQYRVEDQSEKVRVEMSTEECMKDLSAIVDSPAGGGLNLNL